MSDEKRLRFKLPAFVHSVVARSRGVEALKRRISLALLFVVEGVCTLEYRVPLCLGHLLTVSALTSSTVRPLPAAMITSSFSTPCRNDQSTSTLWKNSPVTVWVSAGVHTWKKTTSGSFSQAGMFVVAQTWQRAIQDSVGPFPKPTRANLFAKPVRRCSVCPPSFPDGFCELGPDSPMGSM